MSGTKRKNAPLKNGSLYESKKPKTAKVTELVSKSKFNPNYSVQAKKLMERGSADSDSESDGGVSLSIDAEHDEEDDDEENELPKKDFQPGTRDGLHPDRVQAVAQNSQSSKEAHAKQKQIAQERKAAKPLADSLARTKKIWERLRRKSHVPLEERKKLVAELFDIITGRIKDFVLKHDSVRVVQTAIKYANLDQRRLIARELSGTYRQLAESRYAKFLIGKLLVQGDDHIRDIIVPEFFGHVRRLIKHLEASWILDDIYRGVATRRQKSVILREWYGAEFALFRKDESEAVTAQLSEILNEDPGKRAPIMRSLQELINQLVQKKMTGFTLLHDAMLQFLLNAKPGTEEVNDFMELLKSDEEGDLLKNLAFTKSGSRVVCLALALGNAKDRKQILRTYKDTLQMMAADQHGHVIILAAYETIDDTVLTAKSIFPELLSKDANQQVKNAVFSANDINARTTLLYLYQGRSRALFPNSHGSDLELLEEIDQARTATSKKDPATRREELARALSPYLLKVIETAAAELAKTSFGCQFLTEVLFGAEGDKSAALNAIAATAAGDPAYVKPATEGGVTCTDPFSHIAGTSHGGKMLKALIAGGRYDPTTKLIVPIVPELHFANTLYPYIKGYIVQWATGSSSFVILALLESSYFSKKEEVLALLKSEKKKLQKASKEETPQQRSWREASEAKQGYKEDMANNLKNSAPVIAARNIGNKGSALLLKLL